MAFCNHSLYCVCQSSHQPIASKSPVASAAPANFLRNPYRGTQNRGTTVWVAKRCACAGSALDPILKFDANGKLLGSFGEHNDTTSGADGVATDAARTGAIEVRTPVAAVQSKGVY